MDDANTHRIHPKIQLALASGVSIVVLAWFSKRVLPEPLGYLELAVPPFLAAVFETATTKVKGRWYGRPWCGILLVLLATAAVIGRHTLP